MPMKMITGLAIVVLGFFLVFNAMLKGWAVFLILALLTAWAAAYGVVGKWGYLSAALFAAFAVPAMMFRSIGVLFKLLPLLLVLYGVYALLRAFGK